ncbi:MULTISPECIES: hypothetical protein [Vibrio]|uniref:Uncharacterized protein n=1 Tax=Vibrio jasicida TaxID=766224 RepID=A0AAU9QV10_9VIBR|nr:MULTISPECIES: hypothetical protein [Vibrio]MCZ2799032.1 hypothetical protein [Vibrio alginolyticus]PAW02449.1 hypothetical protein CKJ79_17445 [Vibrio coralliilyticus]CAH1588379.1 conserved hypothetical protein [Vibrio jasicida]CAH1599834.1 conserved hypothetical protein [Vibrio jasicida]
MYLKHQRAFNRGVMLARFLEAYGNAYEGSNLTLQGEIPVFVSAPTLPMSTYTAKGYLSEAKINFHDFDNELLASSIQKLEELGLTTEYEEGNINNGKNEPVVIHEWSSWNFRFGLGRHTYAEWLSLHQADVDCCFTNLGCEAAFWNESECGFHADLTLRWPDD